MTPPLKLVPTEPERIVVRDTPVKAGAEAQVSSSPESHAELDMHSTDDDSHELDTPSDGDLHDEYRLDDVSARPGRITTVSGLIDRIKEVLGAEGVGEDLVKVGRLWELLDSFDASAAYEDWKMYIHKDGTIPYTRNGVSTINEKATLLILVWNPHMGSMVHDHAGAHCLVRLLSGQLTETRYEMPHAHGQLELKDEVQVSAGQVTYMSDDVGLHKMWNDTDEVAISMHLYTPPTATAEGCNVYDEATGNSQRLKCSLHTDGGRPVNACD